MSANLAAQASAPNSIEMASKAPPYGSPYERRSASLTPSLDAFHADLGSKTDQASATRERPLDRQDSLEYGVLAPGAKRTRPGELDEGALGLHIPLQPEAPLKKKKKSKMHTCEICQKKFPRFALLAISTA